MGDSSKNGSQATIWNATQEIQQDPPYVLHMYYVMFAVNTISAITACLGNALIFVALGKNSSLHPPSKMLYRSLAISDLCVGLILQPLFGIYLVSIAANKSETLLAYVADVASIALSAMLGGASLFTITAISVDRLLALSLGLRYRRVVTLNRVRVFVVFLWIGNIANGTSFFWFATILLVVSSAEVLLCVVISSYCYIKIYLKLRHHKTRVQDQLNQGEPKGSSAMNIERYRKTVSSAQYVYFTLLACYIPYAITAAVMGSRDESSMSFTEVDLALILINLNSSLNPILYCWKMREVRFAVKELIRQLCCGSSEN